MLTLFLGIHPKFMMFHLCRDFTKNQVNKRPEEKKQREAENAFHVTSLCNLTDDVAEEIIVY